MARVATIPAEADLLCEGCGYVLNGLPPDGRCPECGKSLGESAATLRHPPAWEQSGPPGSGPSRFLRTSSDIIFRPSAFFRGLSVNPTHASRRFAQIHWAVGSALFGAAAWLHMDWSGSWFGYTTEITRWLPLVAVVGLCYLGLGVVSQLAARLTAWEAGYRGIRLPLPVVLRGLDYHAAHYLPVALLMSTIIFAYHILLRRWPLTVGLYATTYLYVLSGGVILSAVYLFKTYWIGMRNMMYANR